jgi:hypothetical protein
MLKKLAFTCAALIVATAAFSTSAQAQRRSGGHVGGAHFSGARVGGAHIGGARVGGAHVGGARFGGRYYGGGYRGRYYGGGWGYYGGGVAAGAILGGLLAAPYYYGAPYYNSDPGYVYESAPVDAVGYCMQRFRSYDPRSGTYLGNDGYRHPCP